MTVTLYKVLPSVNPDHLKSTFSTHYLPTELVIKEPKLVVPQALRCFNVRLYLVGGLPLTLEELVKTDYFKTKQGLCYCNDVRLYEVYGDCGDDGHIDWRLYGWVYVDDLRLKEEMDKPNFVEYGYNINDAIRNIIDYP